MVELSIKYICMKEEKRWQMDKKEIADSLMPILRMLELGQISPGNASSLIASHILALFEVWKKEQEETHDPV